VQRLQPEDIENQFFPVVVRGYDREKVDAFLQVAAAYYREALRVADEQSRVVASPNQPFEALGGQIATILGTAAAAADDLKLQADRESQRMRSIAAAEAAEITQEATNQLMMARQLKADAQQEAEMLRGEVNEESARLQQVTRERISRLEDDSRNKIVRMEEAARIRVQQFLDEGRRRYEQLRGAELESAATLRTVESSLRKAREMLTAEQSNSTIGTVLADATDLRPTDKRNPPSYRRSGSADEAPPGWQGSDSQPISPHARRPSIDASARYVNAVSGGVPEGVSGGELGGAVGGASNSDNGTDPDISGAT
jgi:DivIVA domain-containing protein